jgi:hypothetical protein
VARDAVQGADVIRRRMRQIQRNVRDATSQEMDTIAEDLLLRSQLLCKEDEGDLIASGAIAFRNRKDTYVRVVYYDTPYAVRQHECTEMGLGPKTKAKPSSPLGDGKPGRKWLSRPFVRHRKRYIAEVGDAISDAIRGSLR